MTIWLRGLALLGAMLMAGACSMETALNVMSSPEERQFAQDFASNLHAGNEAWFQERMEKETWEQSQSDLKAARAYFPGARGETMITGFEFSDNRDASGQTRNVSYTLVTESGGRWVETKFLTVARGGGAPRITAWEAIPHNTRPAGLRLMEASEKAVPWIRAVLIGILAIVIGIVWAIVRYNKRKRAEWNRSRPGGGT